MKKIFTTLMLVAMTMFSANTFAQTVVLDENFDAFTNGSADAPGTVDITGYSSSIEHRLASILTGWTGRYVYEAGGALLIKDGGNLTTGYLNTSTDDACARATFKVKFMDSYGGCVRFTNGYSSAILLTAEDNEWHTMTIYFSGSSYAKAKIEPYLSLNGMIIDDLKIETSPAFISAPTVYQPTSASKTEFTASWKKVTGATGYKLSVYSYDGSARSYLLQDDELSATATSKVVTGLDASKKYFYNVKTMKGEYVSEESEEIEVVPVYSSLDVPVATAATDVTAEGFTANWNAVENADSYVVTVTKVETLSEAQTANVMSEDFAGITKGTLSSPELGTMSEKPLDDYTQTPGWVAANACYASGYMGIAPYGDLGYVVTPTYDLSAANGAFTVEAKLAVNAYGTFKDDVMKVVAYHVGSTDPVETKTVSCTSAGFTTETLNFTCGDAKTYLRIEYQGSNKAFIDEIAIKQNLNAGDKIKTVVSTDNVDGLSKTYALPISEGVGYEYSVTAQVRTVVAGEIGNIYSSASNVIAVTNTPTAISTIATTPADNSIYDLQGRKVMAPVAGQIYIMNGKKYVVK